MGTETHYLASEIMKCLGDDFKINLIGLKKDITPIVIPQTTTSTKYNQSDDLINTDSSLDVEIKSTKQHMRIIIWINLLVITFMIFFWIYSFGQKNTEIESMISENQTVFQTNTNIKDTQAKAHSNDHLANQHDLLVDEKEWEIKICKDEKNLCDLYQKYGIQFIKIDAGSFMMGSTDGYGSEIPVHRVEVNSFYITKSEITVVQYRKCVEAGACSKPDVCNYGNANWSDQKGDRENYPINCVDWNQARNFAKWIGGDLPSEAQWEYASRSGGKEIKYPWGDVDATCEYAVMNEGKDGCGQEKSGNVCSKIKGHTAQGLCDMAGNVWEWVLDEWHESYSGAPSHDMAWCDQKSCDGIQDRVARGGSWDGHGSHLLCTIRSQNLSNGRYASLGFRVSRFIH